MAAGLPAKVVSLALLAQITFASATKYVWSGPGPLVYGGNTFEGVGDYAQAGPVVEGVDVGAQGTTVGLSGIDNSLLTECLSDIRLGAPAKLQLAVMNGPQPLGTPYPLFSGQVDKPGISIGRDTSTIMLALENRLVNLQRPGNKRYTTNDQHLVFPSDTAFVWVPILNDVDLKWGVS